MPSTEIPASSTDLVIIARRTSPSENRLPSGTMTPSSTSRSTYPGPPPAHPPPSSRGEATIAEGYTGGTASGRAGERPQMLGEPQVLAVVDRDLDERRPV